MKRGFLFFLTLLLLFFVATDVHAKRVRRVSFKRTAVGAGMSMSGGNFKVGVDMGTPVEIEDGRPLYCFHCGRCGTMLPVSRMQWAYARKNRISIRCQQCGTRDYYSSLKRSRRPKPNQNVITPNVKPVQKPNPPPKKKQHKAFPSFEDKRTLR